MQHGSCMLEARQFDWKLAKKWTSVFLFLQSLVHFYRARKSRFIECAARMGHMQTYGATDFITRYWYWRRIKFKRRIRRGSFEIHVCRCEKSNGVCHLAFVWFSSIGTKFLLGSSMLRFFYFTLFASNAVILPTP